jgi:hypothetical protein
VPTPLTPTLAEFLGFENLKNSENSGIIYIESERDSNSPF